MRNRDNERVALACARHMIMRRAMKRWVEGVEHNLRFHEKRVGASERRVVETAKRCWLIWTDFMVQRYRDRAATAHANFCLKQ